MTSPLLPITIVKTPTARDTPIRLHSACVMFLCHAPTSLAGTSTARVAAAASVATRQALAISAQAAAIAHSVDLRLLTMSLSPSPRPGVSRRALIAGDLTPRLRRNARNEPPTGPCCLDVIRPFESVGLRRL